MKLNLVKAATSQILAVFIRDSSSTVGAGLTGLAFGSAGLTAYYWRETDATATAITLVTMTLGTYTSGGFKEMDSTNMPGWYSFCPPNAAFASGNRVAMHLKGATNMAPLPIEVQLTGTDPGDAFALFKEDWTGVTGEASHSMLNALRFLRNRWTLISGTLSVYKEDNATLAWSETISTTPGAAPITSTSG